MRTEYALLTIGVVVLAGLAVAAVVVPGLTGDPVDDEPLRIDVAETTLETQTVTAETATFDVRTYVRHRSGTIDNATITLRAVDADSGLLVDTTTVPIEDINGEAGIDAAVTVPREGSYEIRTVLHVDDQRTDQARTRISGLEALEPPHAQTTVAFQDLGPQPAIEYAIADVTDGEATLDVTTYLENTGDDVEPDIDLVLTARHAEAGVVVDRVQTSVGVIEGGRTATETVTLSVKDGSNYYLDATLWRDDVMLGTARAAANLDPDRTIDIDETVEDVQFEAEDFEDEREPVPRPEPEPDRPDAQPGLSVLGALVALLVSIGLIRRWQL